LIGVEPEIIQCAPANRVGVLILRKGFAVPSDRIAGLSDTPLLAAVTLVVKRAVVCPAGFLRWRVESDVTDVGSSSQRHAKGLDRAIEVLVIQRILVVPDALAWISHFVTHKPDAIVSRIRLHLIYCCARPSHDGRLHPHGRAERRKREIGSAGDRELTIGDVVKHVALVGMRLAPCVFVRTNVCRFAKIGGTLIEVCVQVVYLHANPMRHAVVVMGGVAMIVGARWKRASERIDPCARTDLVLVAI
jgi:hypothetical protein